MPNNDEKMLAEVRNYFDDKFSTYGANHKGLDFGSAERQQLCFSQIMKIWTIPSQKSTVNDFGCGYGALVEFLDQQGYAFTGYTGYDISEPMIEKAQESYENRSKCYFTTDPKVLKSVDYTVASGVFNIKLDADEDVWLEYILNSLNSMWENSKKGMAFNILTKYSDAEKMRPDLYYADPCFLFDYCKRNYARDVALLHDYGAYEFTLLIRRHV